ncbi:hypothetical protein [Geobacter sp. SVR]|uniref:hypothetical protein n=1 Tax=Geobacter sp. SVR TaxID=2495594 RepID=UPI00143F0241|nr:hypothetical protein [Geobacter sp. SVR]BCS54068.1 hypothetical protein GSVR_23760 [Geobacter sp. SVR]GCF87551.1 hypothetical protein GSbR_41510 [Geobacter sp. SVR]
MVLEELVSKAISDYAGTAVRVAGLEESVKDLRKQIAKALDSIQDTLRQQATILERLSANVEDHKNLHRRLDEVEEDHSELAKQVEGMDRNCVRDDYDALAKRVQVAEGQATLVFKRLDRLKDLPSAPEMQALIDLKVKEAVDKHAETLDERFGRLMAIYKIASSKPGIWSIGIFSVLSVFGIYSDLYDHWGWIKALFKVWNGN